MKALPGYVPPKDDGRGNLFFASSSASGVRLALTGVLWLVDDALS